MRQGILWMQFSFWLALGLLSVSLFLTFFHLFQSASFPRQRWPIYLGKHFFKKHWMIRLLFVLFRVPQNGKKLEEKGQMLLECGLAVGAAEYVLVRRLLMMFCLAVFILLGGKPKILNILPLPPTLLFAFFITGFVVLLMDNAVLDAIRRQRRRRIVREIYLISHQLLYYNGSKMNLHGKLMRCLPFARVMKRDLERMLNEWYTDAEEAIARFKARLGTDEGYSFAETLNSLRLYDTESYYELLRQRIRDYKEKIDLLKESRKETLSYLLFVLSGIPILYTFRVFIYPWVAQGQKLFDALN